METIRCPIQHVRQDLSMKDKLGPVNVQEMVALVREFKGGKKEIPLAPLKSAGPPVPEGVVKLPSDLEEILPGTGVPPPNDITKPLLAPSGELAAKIREGAGIYQGFCLNCHGPGGTGSTVRAAMPPIPSRRSTRYLRRRVVPTRDAARRWIRAKAVSDICLRRGKVVQESPPVKERRGGH